MSEKAQGSRSGRQENYVRRIERRGSDALLAAPFVCKTATDRPISGTYKRIRSKPLPRSPNSTDDSLPPKVDRAAEMQLSDSLCAQITRSYATAVRRGPK